MVIGEQVLRCCTWDLSPGRTPPDTRAVSLPTVAHTLPPPVEFSEDVDEAFENPAVLALESPAADLVRWGMACRRGDARERELLHFVSSHHRHAMKGWRDQEESSFRLDYRFSFRVDE
jgi:hypothetical protein